LVINNIEFVIEKSSVNYKVPKHFKNEVIPYCLNCNIQKVVDFGAGKYLILTKILNKNFPEIFIVETENQIVEIKKKFDEFIRIENISLLGYEQFRKLNNSFDLIVCSNILHIIPIKEKRIEILNVISEKLKNGGFLYIKTAGNSISHISDSKKSKKYGDGYAFIFRKENQKNLATFRTGFSIEQLISMIPNEMKIQKEFIINSKEISIIFRKIISKKGGRK